MVYWSSPGRTCRNVSLSFQQDHKPYHKQKGATRPLCPCHWSTIQSGDFTSKKESTTAISLHKPGGFGSLLISPHMEWRLSPPFKYIICNLSGNDTGNFPSTLVLLTLYHAHQGGCFPCSILRTGSDLSFSKRKT